MLLDLGCEGALARQANDFCGVWHFADIQCFSVIIVDLPLVGVQVVRAHHSDELICNEPKVDGYYVVQHTVKFIQATHVIILLCFSHASREDCACTKFINALVGNFTSYA